MRYVWRLLAVLIPLALEVTFLRMNRAETSLADTQQTNFEKLYDIHENNCDRSFMSATRHCDGVFMLKGELTEATVVYSCNDERCKFECGR
jgi:hypothetical protein